MNLSKKRNGGFTLIELLSTIIILSLVASIAIVVSSEIFQNSEEKTYEVTTNLIVNAAGYYAIEELDLSIWQDCVGGGCNYQYQCVTVQALIERGYFSNDILNSKLSKEVYVSKNDTVYLERNKDSKEITVKKLDTEGKCGGGSNNNDRNNPIIVVGKTLRYTGDWQNLVSVYRAQGDVYFSLSTELNSSNYDLYGESSEMMRGKPVGKYTVYYYAVGTESYDFVEGSVIAEIKKLENPTKIEAVSSLKYTGSNQNLVIASNVTGDVYYSTEKELTRSNYSSDGKKDIPMKWKPGTYTVYYYVNGYTNYETISGSVTVEIKKADNPIKIEAVSSLKYTGSNQKLVITSDERGRVYYSTEMELTSSNYLTKGSRNIPEVVDAGQYSVYYYVTGNDYYDKKAGVVASEIDKIAGHITLSSTSGVIGTKSTNEFEFGVTSSHGGSLTVQLSLGADYFYNCSTNPNTVSACVFTNSKINISGLKNRNSGTISLIVHSAATKNYNTASAKFDLYIKDYTLSGKWTWEDSEWKKIPSSILTCTSYSPTNSSAVKASFKSKNINFTSFYFSCFQGALDLTNTLYYKNENSSVRALWEKSGDVNLVDEYMVMDFGNTGIVPKKCDGNGYNCSNDAYIDFYNWFIQNARFIYSYTG